MYVLCMLMESPCLKLNFVIGSIPLLNSTVTLRYFSVDSHDVPTEQCSGLTVHTVPSHENVRAGHTLF